MFVLACQGMALFHGMMTALGDLPRHSLSDLGISDDLTMPRAAEISVGSPCRMQRSCSRLSATLASCLSCRSGVKRSVHDGLMTPIGGMIPSIQLTLTQRRERVSPSCFQTGHRKTRLSLRHVLVVSSWDKEGVSTNEKTSDQSEARSRFA